MLFSRFFKNGYWMLSEKLISVVSGFFITVYTARYLGPESMGVIIYIISVLSIVVPLSQLGTMQLIFDKTLRNRNLGINILLYSKFCMNVVFILIMPLLILFLYFNGNGNDSETWFLIVTLIAYVYYQTLDNFSPFFDSILSSRTNVIATNFGVLFSHVSRLIFVIFNLPMFFFGIPYLISVIVPYGIKSFYFNGNYRGKINPSNKRKKVYREYILKAGVPLAISSFSVLLYVKVGQVILGGISGFYYLGIYNAANALAQAWLFIPITLITIGLTKALKLNGGDKIKALSVILSVITILMVLVIIFFFFLSYEIVSFTFGVDYLASSDGVFLLSLASFFSVYGVFFTRVIVSYGGYNFLMKKMFVTLVFNLIISYVFINAYGLIGAYCSIIITEFLSSIVFNAFYQKVNLLSIFKEFFNLFNNISLLK
ncbi:oligosaccharide flippase family protein [Shewanella ulleungensis]|nr:oligosaccharide flippase family protein [Shewanella ulleungensis]MCL1151627.1 oligosaccharide flippase family protein [Shewanella ulleungensis]